MIIFIQGFENDTSAITHKPHEATKQGNFSILIFTITHFFLQKLYLLIAISPTPNPQIIQNPFHQPSFGFKLALKLVENKIYPLHGGLISRVRFKLCSLSLLS
uniref:Uncharacterized protein n=1 Tax=Opuntia streptacantha TaxID=393608 RepID=A0A7C8YXJ7_OPUST